jgi:hypothetical protein
MQARPPAQVAGVPHTVAFCEAPSPGMPMVGAGLHGVAGLKLGVKLALTSEPAAMQALLTA